MKWVKWLPFVLCLTLCALVSPDPLSERIIQALTTFSHKFPQEKVYLQLDKDYYSTGETIWFKAYITLQDFPTNLSTNLYVELLNGDSNVVTRDILPINDGVVEGSIVLPLNFLPGNYRIRAYTAWMLNFDPDFLFQKDLTVWPTNRPSFADSIFLSYTKSSAPPLPGERLRYAVQFFPEGGDLVDGLSSRVAFKAINPEGLPVEVSGKLVDEKGDSLAGIQSLHDGMGSFSLTPSPGQSYSAVLTTPSGDSMTFPLPAALTSGIVLRLITPPQKNRLYFNLSRSDADKENYNRLKLVAQMQNSRIFIADIDFDRGLMDGMIRLDRFPPGIMQVTVMDTSGTPLAERLVFTNKDDQLPIHLQASELNLGPRGKNVLQITVPGDTTGTYSISVTDPNQVQSYPDEDNILSSLLLTSDIHGFVYHPGWYFRNRDTATLQALDLVMMTNGWRRFSWQKIMNNQFPSITFPAEHADLVIQGRARSMKKGKISLMIKVPADSTTLLASVPVDAQGDFIVTGLNFHDTAQVYYQGSEGQDQVVSTNLQLYGSFTDNLFKVPLTRPIHPVGMPEKDQLDHFLQVAQERNQAEIKAHPGKSILLKQVTVEGRREDQLQKLEERYPTGEFKGGFDQAKSFDVLSDSNAEHYPDIFRYLMGQIPGLTISNAIGVYTLNYHDAGSPALFLNEAPVPDQFELIDIPMDNIAYVKFFYPPFLSGGGNFSKAMGSLAGAIAVYTKKGADTYGDEGGLDKGKKVGYTLVREFYSPDYSLNSQARDTPDQRTTIYWNPEISMDKVNHSAAVSFYNNDLTQQFHVIIEGMDQTGQMGRLDTILKAQ